MDSKQYTAVVMVAQRMTFRTNAEGEQLTNIAHEAAAAMPTIDGYQPKLMECIEGVMPDVAPIPPLKSCA